MTRWVLFPIRRVPGGKYHIYTFNEMKTFDTSECVKMIVLGPWSHISC